MAADVVDRASLSDAQRRVLIALCRPFKESTGYVTPATNQAIADELVLSVDAIKTHLRVLFAKFGIEALPQNQKRIRLVELALRERRRDDARALACTRPALEPLVAGRPAAELGAHQADDARPVRDAADGAGELGRSPGAPRRTRATVTWARKRRSSAP